MGQERAVSGVALHRGKEELPSGRCLPSASRGRTLAATGSDRPYYPDPVLFTLHFAFFTSHSHCLLITDHLLPSAPHETPATSLPLLFPGHRHLLLRGLAQLPRTEPGWLEP